MMVLAGLIVATFIAEDATCVAAGLLIRRGEVGAVAGIAACAVGILIGDLGLWWLGRSGGNLLARWPSMKTRVAAARAGRLRAMLDRHPAIAMFLSRLLPGSRAPLYIAAGLVGMPVRRFAFWASCAIVVWVPVLVLASAATGGALASAAPAVVARHPYSCFAAALALVLVASPLAWRAYGSRLGLTLAIAAGRWRRWEFWPPWLFYVPVAGWIIALALRYRGFGTIAAANPGMADGGLVGESKGEILQRLPPDWTVPSAFVGRGSTDARERAAFGQIEGRGWTYPLVLKPDVGERGAGVRLARSRADVHRYLAAVAEPVLIQPFHPGPGEAGILYYREPGAPRGRILAITDKRFPTVTGDGRSTLAQLILAHPRFRLQARLFFRRHRAATSRVLAAGERFTLTMAGNHAQGAIFRDGLHLWTPALEARIDGIARMFPGFCIGRFDVRYHDLEAFRAGEDLAIVELNGASGEPTNVYAPDASLFAAYRALCRHWTLVFRAGHANRVAGARPASTRRLIALARAHLSARAAWDLVDEAATPWPPGSRASTAAASRPR